MATKIKHVFVPRSDIRNENVQLKRLKDKSKILHSETKSIQRELSNQLYIKKVTEESIERILKNTKATEESIERIMKSGKVLNEKFQNITKHLKILPIGESDK